MIAQWLLEKHICKTCGKIMTEYYGKGIYCCKSCAITHHHSEETKKLISEMNKQWICRVLRSHLKWEKTKYCL